MDSIDYFDKRDNHSKSKKGLAVEWDELKKQKSKPSAEKKSIDEKKEQEKIGKPSKTD